MQRYIIERKIPNAGELTGQELQAISQTSCDVLDEMGTQIQWLQSYVTDDAIICIYLASDEKLLREHARRGGFPADRIFRVQTTIDPLTAQG